MATIAVCACWPPDLGPTLWFRGKVPLVLTGVTGAALVTASVILPQAGGAPVPGVVDVVVPAVLLTLALVVAVALTLPLGRPGQVRWLIALAVGVAVAAGAGWGIPVRLTLGSLLLVRAAASMRSRTSPQGRATQAGPMSVVVQAAIGAGLVVSDPVVSGTTFRRTGPRAQWG